MTATNTMTEMKQQLATLKAYISVEEKSVAQIPQELSDLVLPKKQSLIESLNNKATKLEADIVKMEEKARLEAEKESRVAPYKKILAEINSLKMSIEEKQKVLSQAKGAYQVSNTPENLKAFKAANEDFFNAKSELELKMTESKVMKDSLKAG